MKEDLKNIFLMGLGAMSMTSEKAKEMKEELLKKGSELYEHGKVANEELRHNIEEKIKENSTVIVNKTATKDDLKEIIESMSDKEKKALLEELKKADKSEKETK